MDERTPAESSPAPEYPPLDLVAPQLTLRAVATGMLIGGLLSFCNIYSGLKIGWSFNMSITAALIAYGVWHGAHRIARTRKLGLLENNINQTAASSAANVSSAGLVAPIPALTMLTGQSLSWPALAIWTLAVSVVGVVVAIGLRRQLLLVDRLAFPYGIATAETVKEMYARGSEALARIKVLLLGGLLGGGVKLAAHFAKWKPVGLPGALAPGAGSKLGAGVEKVTLGNLGFSFDPSLLMIAFGAIIGMRAAWSMMFGAVIAWGVVGPRVLDLGWALPGKAGAAWFTTMNQWMLWPGVAMMVTSSLTSFSFSWRSIAAALGLRRSAGEPAHDPSAVEEVPRRVFILLLVVALLLATLTQSWLFPIAVPTAVAAVLFTFILAVVAGRVSGETGVTPVGPMGKVTQLLFGVLVPGVPAANLMAANVTGGAASQCADLLHDMKTGLLIGASPRQQAYAQLCGVVAGSTLGSGAYLLLVPDPRRMLLTDDWPAPAVAAWKAVAEIFARGLDTMPPGALDAMLWAGGIGVALAIAEKVLPAAASRFVPSPAAAGLAFVIPAWYSISMFLGAILAALVTRIAKTWSQRFLIVLAAGVIAGESLAGVALAIQDALSYAAAR